MKKPIDPNLNSFSDDFIKNSDKAEDSDFEINIIGEEPRKDEPKTEFTVKTENGSGDEVDFHASENHRKQAQEGRLNAQFVQNFSDTRSGSSSSRHSSGSHHSSSGHHSSSSHHSSSHHHHHHHHSSKKKKMPLAVRIIIAVIVLILLAAAVVAGTVLYLQQTGKNDLIVEPAEVEYEESIEYNGHTYVYDKNKVAFAFLGVDKEEMGLEDNKIGTAGQADTDVVIVVDTNTGKVSLISIPRDTMVDVELFSASGKFLRTEEMQLCLAYAYGDGGASSCTNVTSAISRILYNVPVEKYFALDLEGIVPLNDAIGGVTVTSLYNFPANGVYEGDTVKITGSFAETYVRTRSTDNINASLNRTKRQVQYIQAYVQQLRSAVSNDFSVISNLYNTASQYSETNISLNDVTYIASLILSKGITDYTQYSIEGEMKASEEKNNVVFAEFYPDEDSLLDVVVNCFYTRVD